MGFSLLCVCVELLVRLFSPFEKRQAWHEAWLPVCLWLDRYGCVSNRNAAHYSYNHNEQRKKHTPFHAGFYFCWVVLFVAAETMAMAAAAEIVAWHKACSHFHNKDVWYLVDRNKSPAKHQANKPHTIINTIAFALPLQECLYSCGVVLVRPFGLFFVSPDFPPSSWIYDLDVVVLWLTPKRKTYMETKA